MVGIVMDPIRIDGSFVVRLVHDRDGDVVQVTLPRKTLDEALEEARGELMPYEVEVDVLEVQEET